MKPLADQISELPMNWKDWITAMGIMLTLGAITIKGGQLVERQDQTNRQLAELSGQLHALRKETADSQRDITELRGVDRLHDEQIRTLQQTGRK
jgi:cell division protein FtsB